MVSNEEIFDCLSGQYLQLEELKFNKELVTGEYTKARIQECIEAKEKHIKDLETAYETTYDELCDKMNVLGVDRNKEINKDKYTLFCSVVKGELGFIFESLHQVKICYPGNSGVKLLRLKAYVEEELKW